MSGLRQSGRALTLGEVAAALGCEAHGDPSTPLDGVATLETASTGKILRVEGARFLAAALATPASALLVPPALHVPPEERATLIVERPRLAFAQCAALFHPEPPARAGVHPSAILGEDVSLGEGCEIGAGVILGDGVRIGARARLLSGVILGAGVVVGEESMLAYGVRAYPGTRMGARVRVHAGAVLGADGFGYEWDGARLVKIPHIGGVVIEDDVEIGANTTIDRGTVGDTRIGLGAKIDNLVQIGHNVRVGMHCLIVAQVGISGSARLGDGVVLGGQAGVNPGVSIGAGAQVGGGSGVWSDIAPGATASGNPAIRHRERLRIEAALRRLPALLQQLRSRE